MVLTDFGIAYNMLDEATDRTQMIAGSPALHSTRAAPRRRAEPASDMFSLGATLFTALEGKSPFSGASLFDTVLAVVESEPAPCPYAGPLRPVIEGLLAKNPADRLTGAQARIALVGHPAALQPRLETHVLEGVNA